MQILQQTPTDVGKSCQMVYTLVIINAH